MTYLDEALEWCEYLESFGHEASPGVTVTIYDRRWHGWARFHLDCIVWLKHNSERAYYSVTIQRGWMRVPKGWKFQHFDVAKPEGPSNPSSASASGQEKDKD